MRFNSVFYVSKTFIENVETLIISACIYKYFTKNNFKVTQKNIVWNVGLLTEFSCSLIFAKYWR